MLDADADEDEEEGVIGIGIGQEISAAFVEEPLFTCVDVVIECLELN